MPYQLNFNVEYRYPPASRGITIPVVLTVREKTVDCRAKVDTGAEHCLFQRELAEGLDLDLESGEFMKMSTLGGPIATYGHQVIMQTLGMTFDVMVYFAEDYGISRNLLGRHGWLEQVKVGLIDHDEVLYISPYNE